MEYDRVSRTLGVGRAMSVWRLEWEFGLAAFVALSGVTDVRLSPHEYIIIFQYVASLSLVLVKP